MRSRPWVLALVVASVGALAIRPALGDDEEPPKDPPAEPAPEGGAAPEGDPAPEGDGRRKKFAQLNLVWTLPPPPAEGSEDPVWGWGTGGNENIAKDGNGIVALAGLAKDGATLIEMELHIQPAKPGAEIEGFIDNQGNLDNLNKGFEGGTSTPQTEHDIEVGNWRGGAIVATGKDLQGKALQVRIYIIILKGVIYEVHVNAHDHAQRDHNKHLLAALKGFQWIDTNEGVRGPVSADVPFPSHTEPRGKPGTEEKLDRGALKLKKPAIFAELDKKGAENWVFGAEARKPGAYAWVGVMRFRLPKSQTEKQVKPAEEYAADIENSWKRETTDAVTKTKPGTFKGGKGVEYEFRGTAYGVPYLEHSWIVKDAGALWFVRTQFGGKDAEKALGSDVNSLVKSFTFEK